MTEQLTKHFSWPTIDAMLLPCPFCGGKAYSTPSGPQGVVIRCGQCSARTVSDVGPTLAVAHWNCRQSYDGLTAPGEACDELALARAAELESAWFAGYDGA